MTHLIRNFETLASDALRLDALAIAEAGYAAIDTRAALVEKLRLEGDELVIAESEGSSKARETRRPLGGRRVFFVGIGKCAIAAAEAVERILGERLTGGIALDVAAPEHPLLSKVVPYVGTHPLPSAANERATEHIVELLSRATADDLILALISGGGSTLLCLNELPMTCLDESTLFEELTARGATIRDLNTVRKHTSRARGGGLAAAAYPAEVVALIVSDVPGNDIATIASGPTVRDVSTVADAEAVLAHYRVAAPAATRLIETPKEERFFAHVTNLLFLSNRDALEAMRRAAAARGYTAQIVDERLAGEAREVGHAIAEQLRQAPPQTVLLFAGETTVTLGEHAGKGGRNQELALAALPLLRDNELILPFASDGHDNSDHAGAIADAATRAHAEAQGLDAAEHLAAHRSYDFFTTAGDALETGYTESNVSDLIIALKK